MPKYLRAKQRGVNRANLIKIALSSNSVADNNCTMAFLNPWSIANKTTAIYDLIVSKKLDVLAVSESWLKAKDNNKPERIYHHELLPVTHHMLHMPRPDGRGGGIAIIYNKSIKIKVHSHTGQCYKQFEYIVCTLIIKKASVRLIVVYRPNPTCQNNLNVKKFWRDFEKFMFKQTSDTEELIITGDLNFHLDKRSHPNTVKLTDILDEFDLVQKIQEPTHTAGHTLDVLILRNNSRILKTLSVSDPGLCNDGGKVIKDHFLICWTISVKRPCVEPKTIKFRALNKLDYNKFEHDLAKTELCALPLDNSLSADDIYQLYCKTLKKLIDSHAPVQTKTIRDRPNTDWFKEDVLEMKRQRRRAERAARKSNLSVHWEIFRQKCADLNKELRRLKKDHYSNQIVECGRDQKKIFKTTSSWMGTKYDAILPASECKEELAQEFMSYFQGKVKNIHRELSASMSTSNPFIDILSSFDSPPYDNLSEFSPVTTKEITDIVIHSNNKHCSLDPIPTSLAKRMIHLLAAPITMIVNKSFTSGTVPTAMKSALIRPSLKKPCLDPEDRKNYRPVSNLSYISKIMEKAVNTRLDAHLEDNLLLDEHQSAYRIGHSTETLLLKMHDDILGALDQGKATLLVMIDISAAFDVVEHRRLLKRHEEYFGITHKALDWMESYLKDRMQTVAIADKSSNTVPSEYGFPQGSVLGGKKYIMYSSPLANVTNAHDVSHKSYADDSSLYISFCLDDDSVINAIEQLELSLNNVQLWMSANMLMMNDDKTEVLLFASKNQLSRLSLPISIKVGNMICKPMTEARNLGIVLDPTMSLHKQINSVTSMCYYYIRKISKVRRYLTTDAARSLMNAYVISRMDYGNALLAELPAYMIKKLQRVQNYAARVINRTGWRDSISRQLKELHWLPIKERIQFKILLTVYKSLNNLAPRYLKGLLSYQNPTRTLRSSQQKFLSIKRYKTQYGKRAFSYIGPKLWNGIPLDIRTADSVQKFKTLLKTHLFSHAFY